MRICLSRGERELEDSQEQIQRVAFIQNGYYYVSYGHNDGEDVQQVEPLWITTKRSDGSLKASPAQSSPPSA